MWYTQGPVITINSRYWRCVISTTDTCATSPSSHIVRTDCRGSPAAMCRHSFCNENTSRPIFVQVTNAAHCFQKELSAKAVGIYNLLKTFPLLEVRKHKRQEKKGNDGLCQTLQARSILCSQCHSQIWLFLIVRTSLQNRHTCQEMISESMRGSGNACYRSVTSL